MSRTFEHESPCLEITSSEPAASNVRNPFATRFTRPDATVYLFPPGLDAAALVAQLAESAWMGEIIGPHGLGKSTLLAALAEELISAGRAVSMIALHEGQSQLPGGFIPATGDGANWQLVVDGYEQLSRWERGKLRRACNTKGYGLLVTAHRPVGLPRLLDVHCDLPTACRVVQRLQDRLPPASRLVDENDVRRAFAECRGNLRETLFRLYDLFEQRHRAARYQPEA